MNSKSREIIAFVFKNLLNFIKNNGRMNNITLSCKNLFYNSNEERML